MPLPEDKGLRGDGRPHVRRFHSLQRELGERLAAFRARFGATQVEIARAVGANGGPTVSLWESGKNVPNGMLREQVVALLDGRRWPELRAAMIADADGTLPASWDRAVRCYRRASRERRPREMVGAAVASLLNELRSVASGESLCGHYRAHDGAWARDVVGRHGLDAEDGAALRAVEDSAYGLRWLELARGRRFNLERSLVPQLPLALLP